MENQEVEMKFGLLITGTMDDFKWSGTYDISEYRNIGNYILTLNFEDIERTDVVKCRLYRDKDDAMSVLLECSNEEIDRQHINHVIPMLITALRDDTALNDNVIDDVDVESFDTIYDIIDAIGKLHSIANIVSLK